MPCSCEWSCGASLTRTLLLKDEGREDKSRERKEGGLRSLIVFKTPPSVGVFGNDPWLGSPAHSRSTLHFRSPGVPGLMMMNLVNSMLSIVFNICSQV